MARWSAQQAAAEAERAHLTAIGKGGKSNGKGKGTGGERIVRDPNAPETRNCHNLREEP